MKTKNKLAHWLWDLFSVSMAAQLGTVPFILYYFHQFPVYFLLTNLIAIPLSTLVIYLAIALLCLFFIPILSTITAFLLNWSLILLNASITFIQHLPASLIFVAIDAKQMCLLVVAIPALTAYYFTKRYSAVFIGLTAFLLVCVLNLYTHYQTISSKKMVVYAGQKNTHVSFIDSYSNFIFSTDSSEIERIATSFWQNNKLESPVYLKNNNWFSDGFVSFAGKRILILHDDMLRRKVSSSPIELDYLIVGFDAKPNMEQLLTCVKPKTLVVDKGVSPWYTNHIKEGCAKNGIECYSIADKGAFIVNLKK